MRVSKRFLFFVVGFVFLTFTGCASIVHGSRQKILVGSTPSGATVTVDEISVTTPGTITLARINPTYTLRFEKKGYEPIEVVLVRAIDGWIWGNAIFGGFVGTVVDYSNGSAYKLTPGKVDVVLGWPSYIVDQKRRTPKKQVKTKPKKIKIKKKEKATSVVAKKSAVQVLDISYEQYYKLLSDKISEAVKKPRKPVPGVVKVAFTLKSNGVVKKIKFLERSSNSVSLRVSVVNAINSASPFPPFPRDMQDKEEEIFTTSIRFQ